MLRPIGHCDTCHLSTHTFFGLSYLFEAIHQDGHCSDCSLLIFVTGAVGHLRVGKSQFKEKMKALPVKSKVQEKTPWSVTARGGQSVELTSCLCASVLR